MNTEVYLTPLQPLPDLDIYNKENLSDMNERAAIISEDANKCLSIIKQNSTQYALLVHAIFDLAIDKRIVDTNCLYFAVLDGMYEQLKEQMDAVIHRYDEVEDRAHIDAYIRVSVLHIDSELSLGIYNDDRKLCRPEIVREEVEYIVETDAYEVYNNENIRKAILSDFDTANEANNAPEEKTLAEMIRIAKEAEEKADDIRTVRNVQRVLEPDDDNSQFRFVKSDKTFRDVAGLREVKEDLQQLVDMIKRPEVYQRYGAKLPKGTIFYGPPGTGKTLLAKAIAGEAGVKFIALSSTDFTSSKWGVVPQMIKELFAKARNNAPCIIFIDEIDMLGMDRGADKSNSLAHRESLNAFLAAMDGFDQYQGVTVIAATNRLNDLDAALTRPGRFDNQFAIPLPHDIEETMEVVSIYMKNKYFDSSLNTRKIAQRVLGQSPASIESVLNEACLIAIKKNYGIIRDCDINEAITKKIIKGHIRDNADVSMEDRKMVAVHEAGHALIAVIENVPVQDVSIMGTTSGAGGVTMLEPQNKHYFRKSDYENQVRISYGGRAAEQLAFGVDMITTGASKDIKRATALIKDAATNYGFDLYGNVNHAPMVYKSISQGNLEKAANKYYNETLKMLKDHVVALKAIAKALLDNGCITGEEVKEIYEKNKDIPLEF